MRPRWLVPVVVATTVLAAADVRSRVSRASLAAMERSFNHRIETFSAEDPFYLLGATRGVYLEDYGAVFTAELNLVAGAVMSPFRPAFTKEEIQKLRTKKLTRIPVLKKTMRDMLVDSAASLDGVPPDQQIVVGVSLFYYSWEDSRGLPSQIVMRAGRQSLLDFQSKRIDETTLASKTSVQEY